MDVEKTMQFLLAQQARFDALQAEYAARQDEYAARQTEYAARQAELAEQFADQHSQSNERMTRIESILVDLATSQERTNAILATLTERHVELAESHKELAQRQNVTEQSLNILITTLERHIANHK